MAKNGAASPVLNFLLHLQVIFHHSLEQLPATRLFGLSVTAVFSVTVTEAMLQSCSSCKLCFYAEYCVRDRSLLIPHQLVFKVAM